jgi:osmotically-inducible protein OsmY
MSEPRGGYAVEMWLAEDSTLPQLQETAEHQVASALASERARGREALTVEVHERVARLAGAVGSWGEKLAARAAAMRVPGLIGVDDAAVIVEPPAAETRSDAQLAGMARSVLDWSWRIPRGAVRVDAADGQLTLSGTLDHDDERSAALEAVAGLAGVREVVDEMFVPPHSRTTQTLSLLTEALEGALNRDARHVHIVLEQVGVRLTGRVATLSQRAAAERAVRRVLGDVPLSMQFA